MSTSFNEVDLATLPHYTALFFIRMALASHLSRENGVDTPVTIYHNMLCSPSHKWSGSTNSFKEVDQAS